MQLSGPAVLGKPCLVMIWNNKSTHVIGIKQEYLYDSCSIQDGVVKVCACFTGERKCNVNTV